MLNIPDLEKRWLHYKIKSYLPYLFLVLLTIVVVIGYTLISVNTDKQKSLATTSQAEKKEIKVKTALHSKPLIRKAQTVKKNITHRKDTNTNKRQSASPTELSPSMNFINNFQSYTIKMQSMPQTQNIAVKKIKKVKKSPSIVEPIQETKEPTLIRGTITITKQDTTKDIQNILHRFEKDKNPALSLFLAKKYYELGDYKKASRYALITNRLNKDIEDSWLVFSKSLVKMHQKDKAIKILQKYIANSHSTNASVLLHDILTGEFQ